MSGATSREVISRIVVHRVCFSVWGRHFWGVVGEPGRAARESSACVDLIRVKRAKTKYGWLAKYSRARCTLSTRTLKSGCTASTRLLRKNLFESRVLTQRRRRQLAARRGAAPRRGPRDSSRSGSNLAASPACRLLSLSFQKCTCGGRRQGTLDSRGGCIVGGPTRRRWARDLSQKRPRSRRSA